jgi:aldehyde:ferredoxin oxidoreductase
MMKETNVSGYAGKFLRVDLTFERVSDVVFDDATLRKYVGGTGIGTKILYEEVSPTACWSDAVNRMTIASGPLGGTVIPGSGTISVVTKGALTNGATSVQANGRFGAYLKFNGYDGVILQGAAKRWLYLYIADGQAELRDANHLLGLGTYATGDAIREACGKTEMEMSVVAIGPAGENQIRFAGLFVDKGHSASHNGPGAVMGSKKLKAIAVPRKSARIAVADAEKLNAIAKQFRANTTGYRGTIGGVHSSQLSGAGSLPVKNYSTNVWAVSDDEIERFSESYMREHFQPRRSPCWGCPADHSTIMTITNGPYAGLEIEEPEYEQMAAWGPVIDNKDVALAAMLSRLNDDLGFENNEAGWLVAWVMECYENAYLSKDAVSGLEMTWGNVEAVKQLLYMIAHRQGCGDWLAEGVMRASQKLGGDAAESAIYTRKGNAPRGHDHRTAWGELFDTVVSNTGTLETHRSLMDPTAANEPGHPVETSTEVASTKGIMELDDSLGTCRFNTRLNLVLDAEAVAAATGWDFTEDEARAVGLRVVNLMKVFNLRAGITREHDYPSTRYGSTHTDGPWKGIGIMPYWEAMLDNYYTLMGWDVKTGKPLPETLRNLGIEHVIHDIW